MLLYADETLTEAEVVPGSRQNPGASAEPFLEFPFQYVAGNRALIFYMLVSAAPGNFNFQAVGNSVAIWQNFQDMPQRPTINPLVMTGHPDLLFNQNEPSFGSTALVNAGTLYTYGCGTPSSTDKQCRLGRVSPAEVLNRSAWTYYAGNGSWSSQISDAVSVLTPTTS